MASKYVCEGSSAIAEEFQPAFRVYQGGKATNLQALERNTRQNARAHAARVHAAPRAHMSSSLVLTMLAFGTLVLILVAVLLNNSLTRYDHTQQALDSAPTSAISVMPGDTLTSIADENTHGKVDTQSTIDWIRKKNNLSDALLVPGQIIIVPQFKE
ncbi:MAG: LysM peptidoglycan-binding domain-containing protein [Atopobiaceae bacterium]